MNLNRQIAEEQDRSARLREKIRLRGQRQGARPRVHHVRNLSEQPKAMQDIFRQRVKFLRSNQQLGREEESSDNKHSDSNSNQKNSDAHTPRPLDGPDSLKSYKLNNVYRLQCSPDRASPEICASIQDLNIYSQKEARSLAQRRLSSPKFIGEESAERKQPGPFAQFALPAEERGVVESSKNFFSKQDTTHNDISNRQLETTQQLSALSHPSHAAEPPAAPQALAAWAKRRVHCWERRARGEERIAFGRAKLKLARAWEAHLDAVRFGAFVGAEQLVTAGEDMLAKLWRVEERGGKVRARAVQSCRGHAAPVCSGHLAGEALFTGDVDGDILCWKFAGDRCLLDRRLSGGTEPVWDLAAAGRSLLVTSSPNALRFWDLTAASSKPAAAVVKSKNLFGRIAFLDETTFAAHCFSSKTLKSSLLLYDAGRPESVVRAIEMGPRGVNAVVCAENLGALICANEDGTVSLVDWREGVQRSPMLAHAEAVVCCAYSPAASLLVSAGLDSSLRLWDLRAWPARCLDEFSKVERKFDEPVCHLAFSPDGQQVLAACSDSSALLFRV